MGKLLTIHISMNVEGGGYTYLSPDIDEGRLHHHVEEVAENLLGALKEMIYSSYIKHIEAVKREKAEEEGKVAEHGVTGG